jgi:hypothetical protein
MITLDNLNKKKLPVNSIITSNMQTLCGRVNAVEALYLKENPEEKPFSPTSGLRSEDEQKNLIKAGKSTALKSKHLIGAAVDIFDPEGKIGKYLKANPSVLVNASLWCEDLASTPTWVHFQCIPPGSGNRWFKP